MQSTPSIDQFVPESLTKFAYQTFQEGKKVFGVAHKTLSDRLEKAGFVDIDIQNHFASKYWAARKPIG